MDSEGCALAETIELISFVKLALIIRMLECVLGTRMGICTIEDDHLSVSG
jgi:hypothetical protein